MTTICQSFFCFPTKNIHSEYCVLMFFASVYKMFLTKEEIYEQWLRKTLTLKDFICFPLSFENNFITLQK